MTRPDYKELRNRFAYHPALTPERRHDHEFIRNACYYTAEDIATHTPICAEQTLALRKIEEAMFWANAAIARQGNGDTSE